MDKQKINELELDSLDMVIVEFILPRLIAYRKKVNRVPVGLPTLKSWKKKLNNMIYWAKHYGNTDCDMEKYENGRALFFKYFSELWLWDI